MGTLPKTKPASKAKAVEEPPRNTLAEWVGTILILLFCSSATMWAFVIPTGSMENTLLVGDHLIVDKLAYAPPGSLSKHLLPYTEVKRGDIIVFQYPLDIRQDYVKRAIGIPGDRIHIVDKQVFVNGKPIQEPYRILVDQQRSNYLNNFPQRPDIQIYQRGMEMLRDHVVNGDLVVPPGYYFAMGDNRDNSADSRFWGLVPRENIRGKPFMIFWSYDAPTADLSDGNIHVDHLVDMALHFFSKTRWDRTFKLIRGYPL